MVKWSRYRPGVAQRVGTGRALLFHDRGTRRGWMFSSTPWPHITPGKDPEPILQEAGWAPGPVWMGGKSRPHRDSILDCPARSQSLYRLSYPAHNILMYSCNITREHTLTWQQIWLSYSLTTGWSFQWLLPLSAWPQYSTHIQPRFGTPTYIALPLTQP